MEFLALLTGPQVWIAFFTLTALELVLGIDNVIFISILVDRLPPVTRDKARKLGLFLAMFMRIGLLLLLSWVVGLTTPLISVLGQAISGRDLILIGGGLFLLWKSTHEIHQLLEGEEGETSNAVPATFSSIILQIIVIDIVFSLDSIITAVGMVDTVWVMIAAVVASVGLMMVFAASIGRFVSRHPSIKMLALSFLMLVGMALVAEGFGQKVPKGYLYFAMAFSVAVEMLNLRLRKKQVAPVVLRRVLRPQTSNLIVTDTDTDSLSKAQDKLKPQDDYRHLHEEMLDSTPVFKGKLLDVRCDRVKLPDGHEAMREYIVHPGAVVIIAVQDNGELLFERQHRYPLRRAILELPAGKIDPGEAILNTAIRELLEETGHSATDWRYLGVMNPCVGYSDERIEIFLARGLCRESGQQLDHGEFLDVLSLSLSDALEAVRSGEITDAKTITALFWAEKVITAAW